MASSKFTVDIITTGLSCKKCGFTLGLSEEVDFIDCPGCFKSTVLEFKIDYVMSSPYASE